MTSPSPVRMSGDASGPHAGESYEEMGELEPFGFGDLVAIGSVLLNLADGLGPYGESPFGGENTSLVCRSCRAPAALVEELAGGYGEEFYSRCTVCGDSCWNDTTLIDDIQELPA